MKLLGALFLVSLAASNLRMCEAAGEVAVQVEVRHHYYIRIHLNKNHTQTVYHFNVTLDYNESLHQLLSLMNSGLTTCTASKPKSYPMDCSDIFNEGQTQSGTYQIFPIRNQLNKPLDVICDMEDGGGWTVFVLRNASATHVNFTRNWNDYKEFFGIADQEYWIGNENLHALTFHRNYEVRFDAKDTGRSDTWEGHKSFSVASEVKGYRLTLGGRDQRSTVREVYGFGYNNGMKFSTFENDNDVHGTWSCAERSKGGWWYRSCSYIYPTGILGEKWPKGVWTHSYSKDDDSNRMPNWLQFKMRPTY